MCTIITIVFFSLPAFDLGLVLLLNSKILFKILYYSASLIEIYHCKYCYQNILSIELAENDIIIYSKINSVLNKIYYIKFHISN